MKDFLKVKRPAAIAHRGGARAYPENTLLAFEKALNVHQMDVLELDVHATRDGVLVVAHDDTVDRCTDGKGAIAELTLAQLKALDAGARFEAFRGARIPTLDETLAAFPNARLNIELKPDAPGLEEKFVAMLKQHGALSRVCIGSEHDAVAERLQALVPDACHFYPAGAAMALAQGVWGLGPLEANPRYDVLEVPMVFGGEVVTNAAFFEKTKSIGVPVFVWVVDEPDAMAALIRDGADGVMTDLPAVLQQVMK